MSHRAANRLMSRVSTDEGEALGELVWKNDEPADITAVPGDMMTRTDYENWLLAQDMSASGVALNQIMSHDEMIAWLKPAPDGPPSGLLINTPVAPRGETELDVSWYSGDADAQTVVDCYVDGTNTFVEMKTLAAGVTAVTFTALASGTKHRFEARHLKNKQYSSTVTAKGTTLATEPTGGPSGLNVNTPGRIRGETELDCTWVNGDDSASIIFEVWNSDQTVMHQQHTLAAGTTARTATGLSPNTTYTIEIYHTEGGVDSVSAIEQGTTLVDGPDAGPSNLSASTKARPDGETTIRVSWTNGDTTAQTEVLYKTSSTATWGLHSTVAAGASSLDAGGLSINTSYDFKARHIKNSVRHGGDTNTASDTTLTDGPNAGPSAGSLVAQARPAGETKLDFSWTNGDGTANTMVRIRVAGGVWGSWITKSPGVTSHTFSSLTANTSYEAEATHEKNTIWFGGSTLDTASTLVDGPDAAPSSLSASQSGTGVDLAWTNGDSTASTQVYRNLNSAGYTWLKTVSANIASATDTIADGDTAAYKVRHIKNSVTSSFSNESTVTATSPAGAPSAMSVTGGDGQFSLSWTNADAYSSTAIYRSINDGTWTRVTLLAAGTTSYVDGTYAEDTKGEFYARHEYDGFVSGNSNIDTGYTYDDVEAAPYSLSTSSITETSVRFNWSNGDSSAESLVYYRLAGGTTWTHAGTVAAGGTYLDFSGLTSDTSYEWFVRHRKTDRGGNMWTKDSLIASFSTLQPKAPAITNLSVSVGDAGTISATWDAVDLAYSLAFDVHYGGSLQHQIRGEDDDGSWTFAAEVPPNTSITVHAWRYRTGYRNSNTNTQSATSPDGPDGVVSDGGTIYSTTYDRIEWKYSHDDTTALVHFKSYYPDGTLADSGTVLSGGSGEYLSTTTPGTYTYNVRYEKNGYYGVWNEWTFDVGPAGETGTVSATDGSYLDVDNNWHSEVDVLCDWTDDSKESMRVYARVQGASTWDYKGVVSTSGKYVTFSTLEGTTYEVIGRIEEHDFIGPNSAIDTVTTGTGPSSTDSIA